MAASNEMVASAAQKKVYAMGDQWQVTYSRFVNYPFFTSTCPSLVHLPNKWRYRKSPGIWISSGSPSASLHLLSCQSSSDAIISICFLDKIFEEHYISKLHFSWPKMSCAEDHPVRGSRAIFVSYKDSVGEVQKFAIRFSTLSEAETFTNSLKDILKVTTGNEPSSVDIRSQISLQSEFMSTNQCPSSGCVDEFSSTNPIQTYSPEPPLELNYEVEQESHPKDTTLNNKYDSTYPVLPPSFTSLIANHCSEVKQAQPSSSDQLDLRSQIVRYIGDSSFQDMLIKVEKIINELGDDLLL